MLALLLLAPAQAADGAFDAVVHALSIKDPPPACEQVEALAPDPVPLLLRVVNEVERPPWVAMRAADCLVTRHAPSIESEMTSWMGDRERKGLGLLALGHLDDMEPALATRIASAAMAGPYRDAASVRIARSRQDSIRALATP
jgi:hypothetical protein